MLVTVLFTLCNCIILTPERAVAEGSTAVVAVMTVLAVMLAVAVTVIIAVLLVRSPGRHCYCTPKQQLLVSVTFHFHTYASIHCCRKASPTKVSSSTSKVEAVEMKEEANDVEEDPDGYVQVEHARYSPRDITNEDCHLSSIYDEL